MSAPNHLARRLSSAAFKKLTALAVGTLLLTTSEASAQQVSDLPVTGAVNGDVSRANSTVYLEVGLPARRIANLAITFAPCAADLSGVGLIVHADGRAIARTDGLSLGCERTVRFEVPADGEVILEVYNLNPRTRLQYEIDGTFHSPLYLPNLRRDQPVPVGAKPRPRGCGTQHGSGHLEAGLVESWNVPSDKEGDPLWNLCLDEVDKVILVHGYVPPLESDCPGEAYWPLLGWLRRAYPDKAIRLFKWCMSVPAVTEINDLVEYIEQQCEGSGCVLITHSTGGLYATAALGRIALNKSPVQDNIIGHIALATAQGGKRHTGLTFADGCQARLNFPIGSTFETMTVCQALDEARDPSAFDRKNQLPRWRQAGLAAFRHRNVTTKFWEAYNDGTLPTHSVCGLDDGHTPSVDDVKKYVCSDFRRGATPAQYFGNSGSSYELLACNYRNGDPVGDLNCHGFLNNNDGNVACQLFHGYVDWADCSVAEINRSNTKVLPIDDLILRDEVTVRMAFRNRSAAAQKFAALLVSESGRLIHRNPPRPISPAGVPSPNLDIYWLTVAPSDTLVLDLSTDFGLFSIDDLGDKMEIRVIESRTSLSGGSNELLAPTVDAITLDVPAADANIQSVAALCTHCNIFARDCQEVKFTVKYKSTGYLPGTFAFRLRDQQKRKVFDLDMSWALHLNVNRGAVREHVFDTIFSLDRGADDFSKGYGIAIYELNGGWPNSPRRVDYQNYKGITCP